MRVLVVEDDAATRQGLASLLRQAGHEVLEASDGFVALGTLSTCQVDFVITDLAMPVMDGIAFITKAREAGAAMPIGVLSAYYPEGDKIKGADFTMRKPVDTKELTRVLEQMSTVILAG